MADAPLTLTLSPLTGGEGTRFLDGVAFSDSLPAQISAVPAASGSVCSGGTR